MVGGVIIGLTKKTERSTFTSRIAHTVQGTESRPKALKAARILILVAFTPMQNGWTLENLLILR